MHHLRCNDEAHAEDHLLGGDFMCGATFTSQQTGCAHKRDSSLQHLGLGS